MSNPHKSVYISSVFGNILERYDSRIFDFLSFFMALHFINLGSPESSVSRFLFLVGLCAISRPIGSFLFGVIADIVGKKKTMWLSILGVTLSTIAIASLPAFDGAIYFLIFFRFTQGLFFGVEYATSLSYMCEHSNPSNLSANGIMPAFSVTIGSALAMLIAAITTILIEKDQMIAWGWRIPFILAISGSILSAYVRKNSPETLTFMENSLSKRNNLRTIAKNSLHFFKNIHVYAPFLLISSSSLLTSSIVYSYLPVHTNLYDTRGLGGHFLINLLFLILSSCVMIFAGMKLKSKRENMILFGCFVVLISEPFFLYAIINGCENILFWVILALICPLGSLRAFYQIELVSRIPSAARTTISGLFFGVSGFLFGSMGPWLAMQANLVNKEYGLYFLLVFASLLGLVGALWMSYQDRKSSVTD